MLLTVGNIHLFKVPSCDRTFFPYSHYADTHSVGPIIECFINNGAQETVTLRTTGLAKLKPNVQRNPSLRVDIYGPHTSALTIAEALIRQLGAGTAVTASNVNPEAARVGPQTLPVIRQSYSLNISSISGHCAGFSFSDSTIMYFDHEEPRDEHIEMAGPEFHIGIRLRQLTGTIDQSVIIHQNVPIAELRVQGELNPVRFAPCEIAINLTLSQAQSFATTIQQSYLVE